MLHAYTFGFLAVLATPAKLTFTGDQEHKAVQVRSASQLKWLWKTVAPCRQRLEATKELGRCFSGVANGLLHLCHSFLLYSDCRSHWLAPVCICLFVCFFWGASDCLFEVGDAFSKPAIFQFYLPQFVLDLCAYIMSCFIVVLAGSLVWAISQGVCKERKKIKLSCKLMPLHSLVTPTLLYCYFFYPLQFLYGASVGGRVTLMLKAGANLELACPSIVVPSSLFFKYIYTYT